ncbi:beta-lactamase [Virgisporangium aurantiacum]|uniref:Beta-lactamase n=1 Tax=Virgisporangium aurantiacum TaxID=175570 RepID=A0A8J3Z497_9ACTN|nr:beta-lactamase [Virgisporangium aurantiacum]
MTRRGLLKVGVATSVVAATASAAAHPATAAPTDLDARFRELEQTHEARLGVYGRNLRTGRVVAYRAHERFAMCSTFKALAAAAVLRARTGLDTVIAFPPADILPNSPITGQHVDTGIALGDACAAAIQYSDNTAGNLLLRQIGGPAGLTRFLRSIGDDVSRLDRWETDLNTAVPGDLRDTTTPDAIGRGYERVTLGGALSGGDREQLVTWLKGNTTSAARFRAGLPSGWVIGDKTGTGDYATANDVGVAWTTRGTPVVLAVLSTKATKDAPVTNPLIADAARLMASVLAPGE